MKQGPNSRRQRSGRSGGRRPYQGGYNRSLESSGPNVKLRGTANQIWDKYLALARDAGSSGDRISAEDYYQHAEHYYRLMTANGQAQNQRPAEATPGGPVVGAPVDGGNGASVGGRRPDGAEIGEEETPLSS